MRIVTEERRKTPITRAAGRRHGRLPLVLDAARAERADVALLGIEMPGLDGISVAAELARSHPATRANAAEIAAHLHLSEGTVRNYLSAAIRTLGAHNRAEALRIAAEKGWL